MAKPQKKPTLTHQLMKRINAEELELNDAGMGQIHASSGALTWAGGKIRNKDGAPLIECCMGDSVKALSKDLPGLKKAIKAKYDAAAKDIPNFLSGKALSKSAEDKQGAETAPTEPPPEAA